MYNLLMRKLSVTTEL